MSLLTLLRPSAPSSLTAAPPGLAWRYVLDSGGTSLGELRAYSRTLAIGVSRTATASCRIRADDPLWAETVAGETHLRVYNSLGDLVFYGPIISDEEVGSGQGATVKLNAADLSWELGKRYIGKDTTGVGKVYTAVDSGAIALDILATTNTEDPTGIIAGTAGAFVPRTITYLWKRVLDALAELGAIQGSYEWALRYTDGTPPIVRLDLAAALGGDMTSDVFLEYGTGRNNCSGYTRARSIDLQADQVWVLGSGSTLVAQAYDSAAVAAYGLREDVINYGDIAALTLLDVLAAAHVAIRKAPRSLLSLTPFPKLAPRYGVDWQAGDVVTARVVANGMPRANGAARIWSADISIDETGNENATISVVPEGV